jgi:pilus assembly protein CpaF
VRGAEVVDLLAALNTGHEGGAGTVHANTAGDVPTRLEALAAPGGVGRQALHAQLAGAVQVVLHVRRNGARRVLQEIAVLQQRADGLVVALPAIVAGRRVEPGSAALDELLRERGEPTPW